MKNNKFQVIETSLVIDQIYFIDCSNRLYAKVQKPSDSGNIDEITYVFARTSDEGQTWEVIEGLPVDESGNTSLNYPLRADNEGYLYTIHGNGMYRSKERIFSSCQETS